MDIDLSKFFDRVQHDRLLYRLGLVISDKRILRMIGQMLRSGIMSDGLVSPSTEGAPQGSPLSPLLSNYVLDELDKELEKRGLAFCRFADDSNIFVSSKAAADRVMASISTFIEQKLRLVVNWEKSKVAKSSLVKFLGMTIISGFLAISPVSMKRALARTKELIPRRSHMTLRQTIERANSWYRGWSGYFKMTQYPSQLHRVEAHMRRRLRLRIISNQKRRRYLAKHLQSRGVPNRMAMKCAYGNQRAWVQSNQMALSRAYPNRWFAEQGVYTRSDAKLSHWFDITVWIKQS